MKSPFHFQSGALFAATCVLFIAAPLTLLIAQEESVNPGINEKFLDPELKVSEWLARFEVESREVFHEKDAILKACGIQPGMTVADVGAGTGLYTRLFSNATGEDGWVYAVEINARFLEHIQARAKEEGQHNITTVLCPQDSVTLAPDSVDVAFVCDVYHHFEFPASTMKSLFRALKPGGTVVVVDFERIEGVSSDWILNHVRAGKEVFKSEIESVGLEFVEEVKVDGLKENYFLRFKKPE